MEGEKFCFKIEEVAVFSRRALVFVRAGDAGGIPTLDAMKWNAAGYLVDEIFFLLCSGVDADIDRLV